MSLSPICILYSQDADFVRRLKAFLSALAQVRHVSVADRLDAVLQQTSPAILLLDLRAKEGRALLEQIQAAWPEILIVALGTPRSEPLRDAEEAGIYAAEDLQIDRRRLQALVTRGFEHLRVLQENRELREESMVPLTPEPMRRAETIPDRRAPAFPARLSPVR
jgi:DNA-binding NtrC family response regulator